jgi:hypothetical protein
MHLSPYVLPSLAHSFNTCAKWHLLGLQNLSKLLAILVVQPAYDPSAAIHCARQFRQAGYGLGLHILQDSCFVVAAPALAMRAQLVHIWQIHEVRFS